MDISKAFKSERLLRSVTGVSRKEFNVPAKSFELLERENQNRTKKTRKRALGGGRKGALKTSSEQLFFCLFELVKIRSDN